MRRIGYHLITLLFAGLSVLGVRDVYNNYQTAETVLQVVDLVGQVLYTVCAAAVVLLRLGRQRREARRFMWAWAGALVWASLAIAVVILLADAAASARPKPL